MLEDDCAIAYDVLIEGDARSSLGQEYGSDERPQGLSGALGCRLAVGCKPRHRAVRRR